MRRVGILGGTFDPVHFGHLSVANQVAQGLEMPVRLLLSARPPHRDTGAAAEIRWELLCAAVEGRPELVPDRTELDRDGPSYMFDTLGQLREAHAGASLCLILGADATAGLGAWYRADRLHERTHLVLVQRPGHKLDAGPLAALGFSAAATADELTGDGGRYYEFPSTRIGISASAIRRACRAGRAIDFLTPAPVVQLIAQRDLYRSH
ncbi:MAG: nicotinate (nicotinamide) nucleotide adenylyltransferase [Pseudomonadota bacterium]